MYLSRLQRAARPALSVLLLLAFCVGLFRWPEVVAAAAKGGLRLCGSLIIPSLFPFFVLSGLTVSLGVSTLLGRLVAPVMAPLFHQGGAGASALVLGLIGGYPVGAKTACGLYQEGLCDRAQTQSLLTFCNNSGPAFVIGAAGIAVFQSAKTGFLLMGIQILSAFLIGILFRPKRQPTITPTPVTVPSKSFARCFTESVSQSAASTLNICAYVILFNILIAMLDCSGLFGLFQRLLSLLRCPELWQAGLVAGVLELSNGIAILHGTPGTIIPASFLLSWGGLSVHFQTLSLLQRQDLSMGQYLLGKFLQACVSAALACLALRLFPAALTAAQLHTWSLPIPDWLPTAERWTALLSLPLWGGWLAVLFFTGKKRSGKSYGNRV